MVLGEAAVLRRIAGIVLALGALLALAPLVPEPTTITRFRILAYGSHLAWYGLLVALVVHAAPLVRQLPLRRLLLGVLATFALVVAGNLLDLDGWSDLAKIAFGMLAGFAFIRAIERPWWLAPICICVPLADAWSVFSSHGVTNAIVERGREEPAWIDWPTIAAPVAGYAYEYFGRLGIVDVLFLALLLGTAVQWQLGVRRAAIACTAGLLATSILAFEGVDIAIPALPLLCLAFLIACTPGLWRDLRADLGRR